MSGSNRPPRHHFAAPPAGRKAGTNCMEQEYATITADASVGSRPTGPTVVAAGRPAPKAKIAARVTRASSSATAATAHPVPTAATPTDKQRCPIVAIAEKPRPRALRRDAELEGFRGRRSRREPARADGRRQHIESRRGTTEHSHPVSTQALALLVAADSDGVAAARLRISAAGHQRSSIPTAACVPENLQHSSALRPPGRPDLKPALAATLLGNPTPRPTTHGCGRSAIFPPASPLLIVGRPGTARQLSEIRAQAYQGRDTMTC